MIHDMSRAAFHVDAVQSFGKLTISFKEEEEGPDCISISGHKIHGFKGSGVLAFRKPIRWQPFALGGGQEFGMRSGTVAVPQAVALAKAARLAVETMNERTNNYRQWHDEIRAQLESYGEAVHILSTPQGAAHIVSFSVRDLKGKLLLMLCKNVVSLSQHQVRVLPSKRKQVMLSRHFTLTSIIRKA